MSNTPKPGTPLPWTSNEVPGQLANSIWTVENDDEDPTYIATVRPPMFSWAQPKPAAADENARYIAYACNTLPELEAKIAALEAERDKLREAILDLNCEMAVSYSDKRIRYVEVQIATTAYEDFKELAAALEPKE